MSYELRSSININNLFLDRTEENYEIFHKARCYVCDPVNYNPLQLLLCCNTLVSSPCNQSRPRFQKKMFRNLECGTIHSQLRLELNKYADYQCEQTHERVNHIHSDISESLFQLQFTCISLECISPIFHYFTVNIRCVTIRSYSEKYSLDPAQ